MSKRGEEGKVAVLQKIKCEKEILFGAFSKTLTKIQKTQKWKEVTQVAHLQGIAVGKDWTYIRDTVWGNWKKRTLEKRDNASSTGRGGGPQARYTQVDHLVLDIMGKDNPGVVGLGQSDSFGEDADETNVPVMSNAIDDGADTSNELNASSSLDDKNDAPDGATTEMGGKRGATMTLRQAKKTLEEAKKKKIDLQNEGLELQNYKMRLEILQLERNLNLPRSQYTRNLPESQWYPTQVESFRESPPRYTEL